MVLFDIQAEVLGIKLAMFKARVFGARGERERKALEPERALYLFIDYEIYDRNEKNSIFILENLNQYSIIRGVLYSVLIIFFIQLFTFSKSLFNEWMNLMNLLLNHISNNDKTLDDARASMKSERERRA